MRRCLALFLVCANVFAQTPSVTTDAKQEDNAGFAVRINVNLVQVDAVVTDFKGKRVTDLKADDFEVFQDGEPQKITNFSYVTEGTNSTATTKPPESNSPFPVPVIPPKREQVHRAIALVVDDLGLSFTSIAYVHTALKKFVDQEIQPGDLVAIIRTSGGVGALQQFTTDKRLLYAAIDQVKFKFTARPARFAPTGLARTLEPPSVGPAHTTAAGSSGATAFKNLDASEACTQETNSAIGSVGAIRYVVQGLRDLPGRKALILFSENLPISTRVDKANDPNGPGVCDYSQVREVLRKLTDAAERSAVVIYTVDARGLTSLAPDAASNPFTGPVRSNEDAQNILAQQRQDSHAEYFWSQGGLQYLAEETGGTFVIHNDIAGAIRDAVDDSGSYYLLGYHPPANTFDVKDGHTKFHRVTVKVKRFGLTVRSRTGFYGFPGKENDNPDLSLEQQFARVLVSPFATNDIHLRTTTVFSQWEKPALTTLLYIDAGDLTFTREADGDHKAVVEVAAITFDVNGIPLDETNKAYTFTATDEGYALVVKNGIILRLQQVVRKPGPYQVRVAVRDGASQKMGSANQFVEVPDLKRGRLALSGIVLMQLDPAEKSADVSQQADQMSALDPKGNEAIRIFKPGEKIAWYYQIFNAKDGPDHHADLNIQVRLFHDGTEMTRTEPAIAHLPQIASNKRLAASGHMLLAPSFQPGDYTLQLVVNDDLAKKKNSTATQWIDFAVENH